MIPSVRYTHDFVRRALPAGCHHILEIGCGRGELARALKDESFEVLAIDNDQDEVRLARELGVDALTLAWPTKLDTAFDAILFTRSLHHIHALDEALDAAVTSLRPGGRIIVEDFRAEGGTDRSTAWFEHMVRDLNSNGRLREDADLETILAKASPSNHDHELHASAAISEGLGRHGPVERSDAAYYFRYLEPELVEPELAAELLEQELRLIASGQLDALGKRLVLTPTRRT